MKTTDEEVTKSRFLMQIAPESECVDDPTSIPMCAIITTGQGGYKQEGIKMKALNGEAKFQGKW